MSDYRIIHATKCPDCGGDLRLSGAVAVHFSVEDEQFDRFSQVDEVGLLADPGRSISSGFHAGSCCAVCNEQLEELIEDSSHDARFSQETDDLLQELARLRTSMEIMRTGEDDAVGKVFGRISAELIRLSREKEVSITIKDGESLVKAMDDGIHVAMAYYDIPEGTHPSLLVEDAEGHECTIVDFRGANPIGIYRLKEEK